jgi:hypothetical protein
VLHTEAELELARGNEAAARQAIREAIEVTLANPSRAHALLMLPIAARLLPPEDVQFLFDRVRDLPSWPFYDAVRAREPGEHRQVCCPLFWGWFPPRSVP